MRNKSKFIAFILSFIPGLAHFYIGFFDRGIVYLLVTGLVCGGSILMGIVTHMDIFLLTLIGGYALIWLIALMDSFSLINRVRFGGEDRVEVLARDMDNNKIISLALALVPGAGHMYLGYMDRGLAYMGSFFFTIFFMGWLNISFLLFLLPLIWFYSFFDAFHLANESVLKEDGLDIFNLLPKINHSYIGAGLIGLGIVILVQKLVFPLMGQYLPYYYRNYIQASFLALVFIVLGVRMLMAKKEIEIKDEGDEFDEN